MKMACLDCLLDVQKRLAEKKRAQAEILSRSEGNSIQESQYFEGEIMALEFVQKVMTRALNKDSQKGE